MVIYLATAFLNFTICFYVLFSNSRAPKATAFLSASLGLWSAEYFFLSYIKEIDQLIPTFLLLRWGLFFSPAAATLLTYQLSQYKNNVFFYSTVAPCFLVSFSLSIINTFIFPPDLKPAEVGFLPEKDTIYFIFLYEVIFSAISTAIYSIYSIRTNKTRENNTSSWTGIATLSIATLTTALLALLGVFNYHYLSSFWGAFANLSYMASALYITNTKSITDLKKSASICAIHTISTSLILTVYLYLITLTGDITISPTLALISIFFLSPLIIFYSKITCQMEKITHKIFSKNNYNKEFVIATVSTKFEEATNLDDLPIILSELLLDKIRSKKIFFYRVTLDKTTCNIEAKKLYSITPASDPCVRYAACHKEIFFSDEAPKIVRSYMTISEIEVVIPIFHRDSILSIIYIGKPNFSRFFTEADIAIFEWLQNILPTTISRIENLRKLKNEINESRKTLSMLEVMNQYHHDIKTPLAVIDGIVSTDIYDKDFQRDIVMEQVSKGTKLIATMADMLKGKRNRKVKKLKLHESIQQCLFLFDNRFEKTSADFNDKSEILGDDIDLKILFSNLLKNASEAADPKRALTLQVSTWNDEFHVYASITDTGTGIPSDTVENLWHLEKSEKETGSAIGLQAVKRITEEHDAQISVNSTLDIGTCFELRFPVSRR